MHTEALNAMRTILERSAPLLPVSAQVLDVGSYDVNGTYRPLVESLHYRYTGLDLTPGPNVDIVAGDPDHYPIPDASYDVVISGSTMEHVARPWRWVPAQSTGIPSTTGVSWLTGCGCCSTTRAAWITT